MDNLNKSILKLLAKNAKLSPSDLASVLKADQNDVEKRVRALEDNGTIVRYAAIINSEKTDEDTVLAWVELNVNPKAASGYDSIANEIAQYDEVISLFLMSGTYDLAVKVEGKSLKEVSQFVNEKLATFPEVTRTATHFIMKQYKDSGVLFEGKSDDRDLVS